MDFVGSYKLLLGLGWFKKVVMETLGWDEGLCWLIGIVVSTGIVKRAALFTLDCPSDWTDTKNCVVTCKLTLGLGWYIGLDCLEGASPGTVLVQRTVLANVDCRRDCIG